MKIFQDSHTQRKSQVSIATAIDGSTSDALSDGHLEQVAGKVDKCSEMLGKLVQALHENKHLTDNQVADMLGYRYNVEE